MSNKDMERVFTSIFNGNKWLGKSRSGTGSTLHATEPLRRGLIELFSDFGISSLIDAPCGTAEWITAATGSINIYMGFDVVKDLVEMARNSHSGRYNHFFNLADISMDVLPKADAIICRDCLVHFPFNLAARALSNFKESGSTYLLATTFPQHTNNPNTGLGGWRPLNMELAPFNFPQPLRILRDRIPTEGDRWPDKSVGVWRLADIDVDRVAADAAAAS